MPTIVRKTRADIAVFNLNGTSYLCDLDNASFEVEVDSEDASGVCDDWKYQWATKKGWKISGDVFVSSAAGLLSLMVTGNAILSVSVDTGAYAFTGTALLTAGTLTFGKDGFQKIAITGMGQGAPTEA